MKIDPVQCKLIRYSLLSNLLRGHSFSTYAQRGEGGQAKAFVEVRTQKRPFLHVFCDILICWKLLLCFLVIGVDFHYRFIKHLI